MSGVLAELLVVTGTGTGIGKTIVTAALASVAAAAGRRVAIVKPGQTGLAPGEPGDADDAGRLAGVADVHEFIRYPDPLSPAAAQRVSGLPAFSLTDCAGRIRDLQGDRDLIIVEGAGGLLVEFNSRGQTIADLARLLNAPLVLVTRPSLGTLNDTALTMEAIRRRALTLQGLVIGTWPDEPDLACRTNIEDLERVAGQVLAGALPEGCGAAKPGDFAAIARRCLGREFGGTFNASDFRKRYGYSRA